MAGRVEIDRSRAVIERTSRQAARDETLSLRAIYVAVVTKAQDASYTYTDLLWVVMQ
jgi:hypothetical protein